MISRKMVLVTAVFLAVGLGSAEVLDSFGVISGTANVESAIEITDYEANSNGNIYSVEFDYSSPESIDSGRLGISSVNSTSVVSGVELQKGNTYNATTLSGGDLEMNKLVDSSGSFDVKIDGNTVDSMDVGDTQ
ncbi:MAG: hypothetical protein ACI9LV_000455 [Candidatus Nanohaloarchaea archaeon]|jgi:hypothetical protein